MEFGSSDLDIIIETNIHRWTKMKKDLSNSTVDRFVKKMLGRMDDLVDASDRSDEEFSLEIMRKSRRRLNKFLDEWEARKAKRAANAAAKKSPVPVPFVDDDDIDDEDEED